MVTTMLVTPSEGSTGFGIMQGNRLSDDMLTERERELDKVFLYVSTPCCASYLVFQGTINRRCFQCHKFYGSCPWVESDCMNAGFLIEQGGVWRQYMKANKWIQQWTGLRVNINIEWPGVL